MRVTWYGKRERKLRELKVDVPLNVLEGFLRAIQSPVALESPLPAIRRRRRTRRKGKNCMKRRRESRGCAPVSVQEQDEGIVEFVDSVGASGSEGDGASFGALGLGRSVEIYDGEVLAPSAGVGSACDSSAVIVQVPGAAAAVPGSVLALAESEVLGLCCSAGAASAVAGYADSVRAMGMDVQLENEVLEVFAKGLQQQAQILQERERDALAELGAASARLVDTLTLPLPSGLLPTVEVPLAPPACGDGVSGFLVPSAAAAAAAGAATAASAAAASAREAISSVHCSLRTEKRRRRQERRFAMKFVQRALARLWRARAAASPAASASCLSPVAAEFFPAPRWGNSPMKRYPMISGTALASASSVSGSVKGKSFMRQLYATSAPFLDPAAAAAAAAAAVAAAAAAASFASATFALFLAAAVQEENENGNWTYQQERICDCDIVPGTMCGGCMFESAEWSRIRFVADCTSRYHGSSTQDTLGQF